MTELTYWAVLVRIVLSLLMGGFLGLERGMKNRPAGLRTYMLVCVGSCLIMLTNLYIYQQFQVGDPSRMSAQVVSGIGFLGAGTIIVTKHSQIRGLTTAAGLWTSAAVGLAIGIGFYAAALTAFVAIFFVLTLLQKLDRVLHVRSRFMDVYLELAPEPGLGELIRGLREMGVELSNIQLESEASPDGGIRRFTATLKTRQMRRHEEVLAMLRDRRGVLYAEEI